MSTPTGFASVKLPATLVQQAREAAGPMRRSVAGQIEYWATLGRVVEHTGLTVLDVLPVAGVRNHLKKRTRRWIFSDEGQVPLFIDGAGDHDLRPPGPYLAAAHPLEDLRRSSAISAVGLQAGQPPAVIRMPGRIVGHRLQADQIEHLDGLIARQGLEGVKLRAGRVN